MLKIRLRRTGAKKQPRYRVVVAESSAPRDGAFVEVLGWYNPQADPAQVVLDTDKANRWIARGAQPSDRVAYLLKQAGVGAAAEPEQRPAAAGDGKPAARKRAARKPAAEAAAASGAKPSAAEPIAAEAPESEGSAGSTVTTAETEPTEAPESEGSAGATPA